MSAIYPSFPCINRHSSAPSLAMVTLSRNAACSGLAPRKPGVLSNYTRQHTTTILLFARVTTIYEHCKAF